mmetsp:Transcript_4301/g.6493  ORF Transcript_4301/g.6493 Transcript_4301/m.6493 type:complete len:318 (+) Transcript_4301:191-1144(+)
MCLLSSLVCWVIAVSLFVVGETFAMATVSNNKIGVFGCGVLGTSLCRQLLETPEFQGWTVTGITKTTNNHESILEKVGKDERFRVCTSTETSSEKFQHVVFCAPPSGFDDYAGAVRDAITTNWNKEDGGTFVFTSSGGIYGPGGVSEDVEVVDESTPTASADSSPRSARLVQAEEACISNGGIVLRLAGLYTLERGAHNYWFERTGGVVKGHPDSVVNLLHYDDAAGSCVAALKQGGASLAATSQKIFLVSDGNPTTRKGICASALKSKRYAENNSMPTFEFDPATATRGKIYNGEKTNELLKWKPRYESFDSFMQL